MPGKSCRSDPAMVGREMDTVTTVLLPGARLTFWCASSCLRGKATTVQTSRKQQGKGTKENGGERNGKRCRQAVSNKAYSAVQLH